MLQTKTIAALLFLAVAGGAAYWQLTRTDEHAETAPPPSPMPAITAGEIDQLSIADPNTGTRVELVKGAAGWELTAPLADTADDKLVTGALGQLADARVSARPAATAESSWSKLKVGADEALTVTLRTGGADVAVLHLSLDGGYLRIGDRPEVYQVHGINRAMLAREVRMWRDRAVTSFDAKRVKSVRVTAADGATAAAARTPAGEDGGKESWALTEGAELVGAFDATVPPGIVARMQSLTAQDFADGQTLAGAGLAPPTLTVTVTLDDGSEQSLLVGGDAGDTDVYLGRGGSERVWTMPKATIEGFARPPLQWRDKTIAKLEPTDVAKIDVTHDGARVVAERTAEGWKLIVPAGKTADATKLEALAGAMRNLRGTAVAEVDAKAAGLRKPTGVIRFTDKTGKTVTVTIGAKRDELWYAGASTREDVLLAADYLVKRLLVGPADVVGE